MRTTVVATLVLTVSILFTSNVLSADYLKEAEQYLDKGEYKAAMIQLKNQLKQNPKDPQARYLLGKINFETGNIEGAEKEFHKAYKLDKTNENYQLEYAKVLLFKKQYQTVKNILAAPFSDNNNESERLMTIGYAFLDEQNIADAKDYFSQAEKVQNTLNVQLGFAKLALLASDFKTAEKIIEGILTQSPDNQEALFLQAKRARGQGEYQQALSIYDDMLAKKPDNLLLLLNRAQTKYLLKDYQGVEEDLNSVLKSNENIPQANYLMALAKYPQKDFSSAEQYAQKVLNVIPDHYPSMFIIGNADFKLGRLNQAEKYFTQILSKYPDNLDVQHLLVQIYLSQNKAEQALVILESIDVDTINKNPQILQSLGTAYLMMEENEKATAVLDRAKKLSPEDPLISERLVMAYLFSGDIDNAINELENLDITESDDKKMQYLLIISYIKGREFEKAKALISKLLYKSPDDPNMYTFLGDIELAKNDKPAAVKSYQKALAINSRFIPAYLGLSKIALINQQLEQADGYFQQILSIDAQYIDAYIGRAAIAEQMDDNDRAIQVLNEGLSRVTGELDKELSLNNALAKLYIKLNRKDELLKLSSALVKKYPEETQALSFQVKTLLINGEKSQAQELLSKIIFKDPNDISHRLQLAALLLEKKEQQAANKLLNEILEIKPGHQQTIFLKSHLLYQQGRIDELNEVLNKLLKADNNNFNLIYRLSVQAQKQEKYDLAIEFYKALLEYSPENSVVMNNLAWLYAEQGNPEDLIWAKKAYDKSSETAAIADTYGYILLKHNKINQAIKILEQAVALNSGDNDIRFHLAKGYYLADQKQKSQKILENILSSENDFSEQENAKLLLEKLSM